MHQKTTTQPSAVPIRSGIVTLSGFGIKVAVDRRHLAVSDGIGRQRRAGRFAKATSRIKRLVVIAQTGFVTLEALRWLHDAKAAFIQLDHDGAILTASIGGLDDARLRRAQALIGHTEYRLPIARELLEAKIKGQLAVLDSFGLDGASAVRGALARLDRADRIDRVLIAEAQAAEAYWGAWADVPMQFAQRDRVPDHWRTFGARRSPLTLRPRNAANPLNAILNLLYKFAEVETRIALIARGIDPSLGFFHQDEANRSSPAADVMEPVRPHVDAFVLNLARTRTFQQRILRKLARVRAASHHRLHKNSRRPWRRGRNSSRRTQKPLRGTSHASQRAAWEWKRRSGLPRAIARESRFGCARSQRPLCRRPFALCRSRRLRMLAAVAAPNLRSESAYSAINVSTIGAKRRSAQLSRAFAPRVQRRSQLCAQQAAIQPPRVRRSADELPPPQSNAKRSLRGGMTDRSIAWISGATFCRSCKAYRCA